MTARLIVVITSDVVAKNLYGSGALTQLEKKFEIVYLVSRDVTTNVIGKIIYFEPGLYKSWFLTRLNIFIWHCELLAMLIGIGSPVEKNYKYQQLPPKWQRLCRVFATPLLFPFVRIADALLFSYDREAKKILAEINPSLVIMPGSAIDTYSFAIGRTAERLNVPTLMIVSHWDYFSKKGMFRFIPDKVYVWGEDMLKVAVKKSMGAKDIFRIVGAPQFQKYLAVKKTRDEAVSNLGLDGAKKWIAFAGPVLPFDEIAVLRSMNTYIEANGLCDIGVIYRPHPRGVKRLSAFPDEVSSMAHIRLDVTESGASNSDEHYVDLIAATYGVVTPWSTMVLEYGLAGKPSLCLAFNDGINTWNMASLLEYEHITPLLQRNYVLSCDNSTEFEKCFSLFLDIISNHGLEEPIKAHVAQTVYFDTHTYADRLLHRVCEDFPHLAPQWNTGD